MVELEEERRDGPRRASLLGALVVLLALLSLGCSFMPAPDGVRARSIDVYSDVGPGYYERRGSDYRVGVSVSFEFTYEDETLQEE